ncbi:MAG: hypothetical protein ACI33S_01965 [Bacilli bacterium]
MIETKDLYIVVLATINEVERKSNGKIYFKWYDSETTYIVAKKTEGGFAELYTDNVYMSLDYIKCVPELIKEGKKFVSTYEPVVRYMNVISDTISLDELTQIVRWKNKKTILGNDYFLQSVLAINSKVSSSNLSDEIKDEINNDLKLLSNEYILLLIRFKEGEYESSNNEVSELKIKEKYFRKLIEIEQKFNLYSDVDSRDLLDFKDEMTRLLSKN